MYSTLLAYEGYVIFPASPLFETNNVNSRWPTEIRLICLLIHETESLLNLASINIATIAKLPFDVQGKIQSKPKF